MRKVYCANESEDDSLYRLIIFWSDFHKALEEATDTNINYEEFMIALRDIPADCYDYYSEASANIFINYIISVVGHEGFY